MILTNGNNDSGDQFEASIRGLRFAMNILGIWPRDNPRIGCYNLVWYFQTMGLAFQIFGPVAGMVVQRHDPSKIIDNLGVVIPTACICFKWISLARNETTIAELLTVMERDWKNLAESDSIYRHVSRSKMIMKSYAKPAKIFIYSYLALTVFSIVVLVGDSLRTGGENYDRNITDLDNLLPLPNSWYPLNYNKSFNIQFLIAAQATTSLTTVLANASIDGLFIAATLHLCGQMKILSHFIEGITYDPSNPKFCEGQVRLMAKRHQELLRVVDKIQKSYNVIFFEHFLACTLTICFLEYIFLAEIEANDGSATALLKYGFLCMATMQITFAYCLVGDLLTNKSAGIALAVYNAKWYDANKSINLSFSLTMIRSGKPVEISAAKLFPLSLENFTVLIKAAASYLSVLRAIGVNDDPGTTRANKKE